MQPSYFLIKKNLVQKHIICVILQIGINTRFFYPISISCAPLWCSSIISITFFKSAIFSVIGRLNRVIVKSDIQSSRFYVQIGIVPIHSLTEWNLRQVLIKVIPIYPFFSLFLRIFQPNAKTYATSVSLDVKVSISNVMRATSSICRVVNVYL